MPQPAKAPQPSASLCQVRHRRTRHLRIGRWILPLLLILCAAPTFGQDDPLDSLRDEFRVIETRQGWALQPRQDTDDYGLIEIRGGQVLIDGREVEEEELRRYVDEWADAIVRIAGGEGTDDEIREAPEEVEERPRRRHRDSQVSFGSSLRVKHDEVVEEVVLIGGNLEVEGDIDGDATVLLGDAEVKGRIDGSLTVIGGTVLLREGSYIDGDLVSVGGRVRRESGAEVDGELTQVAFGDIDLDGIDVDFGTPRFNLFSGSVFNIVTKSITAGLVLLVIFITYFVAPARTRRIAHRAREEPWKSGAVGLIIEVLFAPLLLLVSVLLAVSIVGIPLLLVVPPLLALMLAVYFILGLTGVSLWAGEWTADRFDLRNLGPYAFLIFGLVLIYGWSIIGEALSFGPLPIRITAFILLFFGFVVKYVGWTVGLGAAVLDQFSPIATTPTWDPPQHYGDDHPTPGPDDSPVEEPTASDAFDDSDPR